MNTIRKTVFIAYGLLNFTKSAYQKAEKHFNPKDLDVNMAGKTCIVTGANSGIGFEVASELAKRGATVHMICRNQTRGDAARLSIVSATGNSDVQLHIVDMASAASVRNFAQTANRDMTAVDVLVNNAGIMAEKREVGSDGLESSFATNTVGTFLLTNLLLPSLHRSTQPRVIVVSSGGQYTQQLVHKNIAANALQDPHDGVRVYSVTKRQQVAMTERWAKLYPNIKFWSMHPGWAETPGVQTSMPGFHKRMNEKLRTAAQGADSIVWLACSDAALQHVRSGEFVLDRQVVRKHLSLCGTVYSQQQMDELWKELMQLTNDCAPQ
eukprot:TRINITY_DN8448_c0_g1_i1.p1 TRINITY_DN8448_c0_g1~~TRINITY_DN8448_c0_g1_i1.p1  ORF type:complete len:324 (+),score=59.58 TRINITY_DN8448_c0_g1_i1:67-1038(+)